MDRLVLLMLLWSSIFTVKGIYCNFNLIVLAFKMFSLIAKTLNFY